MLMSCSPSADSRPRSGEPDTGERYRCTTERYHVYPGSATTTKIGSTYYTTFSEGGSVYLVRVVQFYVNADNIIFVINVTGNNF
jgi:hypothetical protein